LNSGRVVEGLGEFGGVVERGDGGMRVQVDLRKVGAIVVGCGVVTTTDVIAKDRHDVGLSIGDEMGWKDLRVLIDIYMWLKELGDEVLRAFAA